MKRYLHTPLLCMALGLLVACSGSEARQPPAAEPINEVTVMDLPSEHPEVYPLGIRSRGPRRLSVAQLERSLDAIGNLPPGTVVIPPDLALTLGQPDFLRTYESSLEPTPLFMKFMMDLGAIVCANFADGEADRALQDRVFTRYEDRQDNLRYMVLRFLGIEGEAATPYVERLGRVYDIAAPATGVLSGYEATCIALFTSPEFLLY